MPEFHDHFSAVSAAYADFRPTYPDELIRHVVDAAPARRLAWDCATGTGQVATALAAHVDRVEATDASAAQIAHAAPHPRVTYRVAPAERSGLPDASVDLLTVAQALHWFDRDAFYREAQRVLRPGGLIAVWTYARLTLDHPDIVAATTHFHDVTVGPDWPPERALVGEAYLDLPFPFDPRDTPHFEMTAHMTRPALAGYLRTWSATRRHLERTGHDPVDEWEREVAPLWPDAEQVHTVRWPLTVRVGVHAG